jgi:tRNA pseudouridine38-40 synthase
VRIALGLEYDGAGFHGWQSQSDGNTVQDALELALAQLAGIPLRTTCAGRTDTGVHALDQVVHFDTTVERPLQAWVRGTNRFLPPGVAVKWARAVPDDFHARYSSLLRNYDYWILNAPVRSPLAALRAGWAFRPLDEALMRSAAGLLLGRHDFSSFRAAGCQATSPVRELHQLEVERRGRWVRIRVSANAFLHHMVRNIVGALVEIGTQRRPVDWMEDLLAARDRRHGAPTFGAAGLYLARVEYDRRFNLPIAAEAVPNWLDADTNQDLWPDP